MYSAKKYSNELMDKVNVEIQQEHESKIPKVDQFTHEIEQGLEHVNQILQQKGISINYINGHFEVIFLE